MTQGLHEPFSKHNHERNQRPKDSSHLASLVPNHGCVAHIYTPGSPFNASNPNAVSSTNTGPPTCPQNHTYVLASASPPLHIPRRNSYPIPLSNVLLTISAALIHFSVDTSSTDPCSSGKSKSRLCNSTAPSVVANNMAWTSRSLLALPVIKRRVLGIFSGVCSWADAVRSKVI